MNQTKNQAILAQTILEHFKKLNTVPRGSNNEKAVSGVVMEFAQSCGLTCRRDDGNNVVVVKQAQGTSDTRPVILQAHMDMVCAVDEAHMDYDFLKNPIYQKTEINASGEEIMTGRGTAPDSSGKPVPDDSIHTTLGADDGIGVASIMSLLEDHTIIHPPIIAVFTTGEEIGMVGAKKITREWLQDAAGSLDLAQARFINVDEEQDGRFCYGCAGGIGVDFQISFGRETRFEPSGYQAFRISVSGLLGGHSGIEIGERHANANRLIGRILYSLRKEPQLGLKLFRISGGSAENAIASSGNADIAVYSNQVTALEEAFNKVRQALLDEYALVEKNIKLCLNPAEIGAESPITEEYCKNIVDLLYLIPNDVLGFLDCDGYSVVETSSNLGIVSTESSVVRLQCSVRSFYNARRDFVVSQMERMAELFDFNIKIHDDYSGWAQSPDSKLKVIFTESYQELFPGEPVGGRSVHAGLECGVFSEILGDIDMIACGPTIKDVHTPKETLYLDTVPKIGSLLIDVLKRLTEE